MVIAPWVAPAVLEPLPAGLSPQPPRLAQAPLSEPARQHRGAADHGWSRSATAGRAHRHVALEGDPACRLPYVVFLAQRIGLHERDESATFEALYWGLLAHAPAEDLGRHPQRAGRRSTTSCSPSALGGVEERIHVLAICGRRDVGLGISRHAKLLARAGSSLVLSAWPSRALALVIPRSRRATSSSRTTSRYSG